MVPKVFRSGASFKKLGAYLLHDAGKAKTSERVKWTHTLNLADDDPGLAIDEMLWTYRAADDLKREAGVKAGGRRIEHPVRHYSLNWHPSENPSREHMIEAAASFLERLGAAEHQALIVCHDDKSHPHIHIMLNAVHPETGRALDTAFEKIRVQDWARAYELEHGKVFCEERLKPADERTPSPTRATWEQLQAYGREDEQAERDHGAKDWDYFSRNENDWTAREWQFLKAAQRGEREQFIAEGKQQYREARHEAYREVRAEFTWRWKAYYQAKRDGMDKDALAAMKEDIIVQQREALDERRDLLCGVLREHRDEDRKIILAQQQTQRQELRERQAQGLRSYDILDRWYPELPINHYDENDPDFQREKGPLDHQFARAAREVGDRDPAREQDAPPHGTREEFPHEPMVAEPRLRTRDPIDSVTSVGIGALAIIANIGEKLFDGFLGGGEPKPAPQKTDAHRDDRDAARRDLAIKTVAKQAENETKAADEARQRDYWHERRKRTRERD